MIFVSAIYYYRVEASPFFPRNCILHFAFALECYYSLSNIAIQTIDGGLIVDAILSLLEFKDFKPLLMRWTLVRKVLGSFVGSTASLAGNACGMGTAKVMPTIGSIRHTNTARDA